MTKRDQYPLNNKKLSYRLYKCTERVICAKEHHKLLFFEVFGMPLTSTTIEEIIF
jgi:hypothetical protein